METAGGLVMLGSWFVWFVSLLSLLRSTQSRCPGERPLEGETLPWCVFWIRCVSPNHHRPGYIQRSGRTVGGTSRFPQPVAELTAHVLIGLVTRLWLVGEGVSTLRPLDRHNQPSPLYGLGVVCVFPFKVVPSASASSPGPAPFTASSLSLSLRYSL